MNATGSADTGPVAAGVPDGLRSALSRALATVEANIRHFAGRYPDDTTVDGIYPPRRQNGFPEGANVGWTTSFWPGTLWLAYELTGRDLYRDAASAHVASFAERVERRIDVDTHDLGFLYTLSCVVPWRLSGDVRAREAARQAADLLMARFLEPAGIVQAWGDLSNPDQRGRTIIDSLMNMPLLYWAGEVSGDPRYAGAARRHTGQLRDHILRPDGTTFHTFYWDPVTGEPLRGATEQGHRDGSCWARGQAWGIYGFSLNHRHTGDTTFLTAAGRCADYFLSRLPTDHVVYWDLVFSDGSGQERDSSAAAIAVCGLDELSRALPPGPRRARYRAAADDILASLVAHYATPAGPDPYALLRQGVYDKPKAIGVNEGSLWGDYFYLEALTRAVRPGWQSHW
jgi:unsaturated chondroitin disaccharide hydrolase